MHQRTVHLLLYSAFFFSGISGLVYQTVWVRMLTRFLGSTTEATAVVLTVFMGGLGLGGWLGGKLAERSGKPLAAYAWLEGGIALAGWLASYVLIRWFGEGYVAQVAGISDNPTFLQAMRILATAGGLLAPTLLMGVTLPLMIAFFARHASFQFSLSRLYALNTFGAVVGVLATGFVLLGSVGEQNSIFLAMAGNVVAGLAALAAQGRQAAPALPVRSAPPAMPALPGHGPSHAAMARLALLISGLSALALEVLWTRMLLLTLNTSIYSFSFMLAVMLSGMTLGSWVSSRQDHARPGHLALLGLSGVLIGLTVMAGLAAYAALGVYTKGFMQSPMLRVLTSLFMILPPAVLFGWQFPIAVRCAVSRPRALAAETGKAYAINTLGSILGSMSAAFVLIPLLGVPGSLMALTGLNIAIGLALLTSAPSTANKPKLAAAGVVLTVPALLLMAFMGSPYRDALRHRIGDSASIMGFYEETAATTVVLGVPDIPMHRDLLINGMGMTSLLNETKVMAHLPLALADTPRKMLVICFGMGTTARSATRSFTTLERIDAVDLVPAVFKAYKFFHADADSVKALPNMHLYANDGRNFLLTTTQTYDVITIDPAPPLSSAGSVNLYTKEFLELCKSRLTEGGVLSLWLPQEPASELKMIMRTYLEVFPQATLWGGLGGSGFYCIGGKRPLDVSPERLARVGGILKDIPDLREWNPDYAVEDIAQKIFLLGPERFHEYVKNFKVITDNYPYTEFPLWRSLSNSPDNTLLDAALARKELGLPPAP